MVLIETIHKLWVLGSALNREPGITVDFRR